MVESNSKECIAASATSGEKMKKWKIDEPKGSCVRAHVCDGIF
jgi:hypothetical protein